MAWFDIENFNFDLPPELIAQEPLPRRESSRLLLVNRREKSFNDRHFYELPEILIPGDLVVLNNTKVLPARLYGKKETGGRVELIILNTPREDCSHETRWCLARSSKPMRENVKIFFDNDSYAMVKKVGPNGMVKVEFKGDMSIDELLEKKGIVPLPPYIERSRDKKSSEIDMIRYQTVFSKRPGAIAAPTAGLHFSRELIHELKKRDISIAEITLHVGYGTFKPVRTKDIRDHKVDPEFYEIDKGAAEQINKAKREKRRIIAVGTTVVRTLESAATDDHQVRPGRGITDLYIVPGYCFRIIDVLITNFHLPRSSLLFLVSAFAGIHLIMEAYRVAINRRYRFYSYGDAMLII